MSDIEVLGKLTRIFNKLRKDDEEGHSSAYELQWEDISTIENLIIENKKLIQENKELNEKRKDGTLSDGYHTYNDLYYQRCVLFATICNLNKDISWKSKKHSDGKKCFDSDNWFIVGIDTPKGTYTYHYEIKYWDLFKVKELELGKAWDGHTEKDVNRLFSLKTDSVPISKIQNRITELEEILQSTIIKEDYKKEVQARIWELKGLLEG